MPHRIPLSRPFFDAQELEAVRRVLESGWVVQGPQVEAFEAAIGSLVQARYCVAVSSGTAALHLCYLAMGIGPGDAVFVPSFAWPSAAHMAKLTGAQPIFVDVLPETYNIDPADLRLRIEACLRNGKFKPRAIVPVHEFGLAAEVDEVLAIAATHSLQVIEDAACALGATHCGKPVGTLGDIGIFSFHPRKSITTGEGGAIVTNNLELAECCRRWRNHGQQVMDGKRDFLLPGLNYRMTEIQAAIGIVQISKFPKILQRRRTLASRYLRGLQGSVRLLPPANLPEHTWQTLMVVLEETADRTKLMQQLAGDGIEAAPGSVAGHLAAHFQPQPALTVSSMLHFQGLALPLHAGLDEEQVDFTLDRLLHHVDHSTDSRRASGKPTDPVHRRS